MPLNQLPPVIIWRSSGGRWRHACKRPELNFQTRTYLREAPATLWHFWLTSRPRSGAGYLVRPLRSRGCFRATTQFKRPPKTKDYRWPKRVVEVSNESESGPILPISNCNYMYLECGNCDTLLFPFLDFEFHVLICHVHGGTCKEGNTGGEADRKYIPKCSNDNLRNTS